MKEDKNTTKLFVPNAQYGLRTKAEILKFLNEDYIITTLCPKCKGFDKPLLALTHCGYCLGSGFQIVDKIKNETYFLIKEDIKKNFMKAEIEWYENKAKLSEKQFDIWRVKKVKELEDTLK